MKRNILIGLLLFTMNTFAVTYGKNFQVCMVMDSTHLALATNPVNASFSFGDTDSTLLNGLIRNVSYTLTSSDLSAVSTLFTELLTAACTQAGVSPCPNAQVMSVLKSKK